MYKATARDVRDLQRWGTDDTVVTGLAKSGFQPSMRNHAYFHPSTANWSWQIGLVEIDHKLYELLTRFGVVEGGREVWTADYVTHEGELRRPLHIEGAA